MSEAVAMLDESLAHKSIIIPESKSRSTKSFILYILLNVLAFFLIRATFGIVGIEWPFFIQFFLFPVGFIFVNSMKRKSAVGTNLWMQARGLKQTINYGKWREEIKEKKLFVEEIFPFAVSLKVVDKLAKDMKDLNIQPPDYISSAAVGSMNTSSFVDSFTSDVGNTLSYNPSSSRSSGGSGFSGGFSGGGGDGGGGGSW